MWNAATLLYISYKVLWNEETPGIRMKTTYTNTNITGRTNNIFSAWKFCIEYQYFLYRSHVSSTGSNPVRALWDHYGQLSLWGGSCISKTQTQDIWLS